MVSALHFKVSQSASTGHYYAFIRRISLLLYAILIIFHQVCNADNSGRIVKWKDEKGVTHYGDKIPPEYSNRENSLMNKQGITVQHNKIDTNQDNSAEQAKVEQGKKDKALLGTFSNAEEIDLTRERNLEPDLMAIKSLQQDRALSQKKCDKISAQTSALAKSKKPTPASLSAELETCNATLAKTDQKIAERQQSIDAIRQRFDDDKKRYLYLRGMNKSQ